MRRVLGWLSGWRARDGGVPTTTVSFGGSEQGLTVLMRVAVLRGVRQRLVGLLASLPEELGDAGLGGVLLAPCAAIHTFGMGYALDVALVGADGTVLASRREVTPGLLVRARGACLVLERPSADGPWPLPGARVSVGVP